MFPAVADDLSAFRTCAMLDRGLPILIELLQCERKSLEGARLLHAHRCETYERTKDLDPANRADREPDRGALDDAERCVENFASAVRESLDDLRRLARYFLERYPDQAYSLRVVEGRFPAYDAVGDPFPLDAFYRDMATIRRTLDAALSHEFQVTRADDLLKLLRKHMQGFSLATMYRYCDTPAVDGLPIIAPRFLPGPKGKPRTITLGEILDVKERIRLWKGQRRKALRNARKSKSRKKGCE